MRNPMSMVVCCLMLTGSLLAACAPQRGPVQLGESEISHPVGEAIPGDELGPSGERAPGDEEGVVIEVDPGPDGRTTIGDTDGGQPGEVPGSPAGMGEGNVTYGTDARVIAGSNNLGFDLIRAGVAASPAENVALSPMSLGLALAMTLNGAAGETYEAISRVLGVTGQGLATVNRANAALLGSLEGLDDDASLSIANSIWAGEGEAFEPAFIERNRRFYGAHVDALDFGDPLAPGIMDGWVSDHTCGKIDRIAPVPIDPLAVMYLINAIHFQGNWSVQFDKSVTENVPFVLQSGDSVPVPMMRHRLVDLPYLRGEGFQLVSLPFAVGRVAMDVLMPDPEMGLAKIVGSLTAAQWTDWVDTLAATKGDAMLPRFSVEHSAQLNEALQALGMAIAFDPAEADFSSMTPDRPPNLYISQVIHKAAIDVDEQGSEAAAGTLVEVKKRGMPRAQFEFRADRPFVYAVRDTQTGALLFLGVVMDPR